MNVWIVAATVVAVGMAPCIWIAARASLFEGIVALQLAGQLATLCFVLMAQGSSGPSFVNLAIGLCVADFASSLFFVRYLERRL